MAKGPQEVTVEDAASVLEVSRATIYNLVRDGKLSDPITVRSVENFLEKRYQDEAKKAERGRKKLRIVESKLRNGG